MFRPTRPLHYRTLEVLDILIRGLVVAAIAIAACVIAFAQARPGTDGTSPEFCKLGWLPPAYVAFCACLASAYVFIGARIVFLKRVTLWLVGLSTLGALLLFVVTIVERFVWYKWSPEHHIAALFYLIVFVILWRNVKYRALLDEESNDKRWKSGPAD